MANTNYTEKEVLDLIKVIKDKQKQSKTDLQHWEKLLVAAAVQQIARNNGDFSQVLSALVQDRDLESLSQAFKILDTIEATEQLISTLQDAVLKSKMSNKLRPGFITSVQKEIEVLVEQNRINENKAWGTLTKVGKDVSAFPAPLLTIAKQIARRLKSMLRAEVEWNVYKYVEPIDGKTPKFLWDFVIEILRPFRKNGDLYIHIMATTDTERGSFLGSYMCYINTLWQKRFSPLLAKATPFNTVEEAVRMARRYDDKYGLEIFQSESAYLDETILRVFSARTGWKWSISDNKTVLTCTVPATSTTSSPDETRVLDPIIAQCFLNAKQAWGLSSNRSGAKNVQQSVTKKNGNWEIRHKLLYSPDPTRQIPNPTFKYLSQDQEFLEDTGVSDEDAENLLNALKKVSIQTRPY